MHVCAKKWQRLVPRRCLLRRDYLDFGVVSSLSSGAAWCRSTLPSSSKRVDVGRKCTDFVLNKHLHHPLD